jgi:hypothetical protein
VLAKIHRGADADARACEAGPVTFPADRRIETRLGVLDVAVQLRGDGRCVAWLAGDYPELAHLGGAIAETEDAAVARLAAMVDDG